MNFKTVVMKAKRGVVVCGGCKGISIMVGSSRAVDGRTVKSSRDSRNVQLPQLLYCCSAKMRHLASLRQYLKIRSLIEIMASSMPFHDAHPRQRGPRREHPRQSLLIILSDSNYYVY